jgi:hypothetical protein
MGLYERIREKSIKEVGIKGDIVKKYLRRRNI